MKTLKTYNHNRPECLPKREAKVRKSKGENQSFFTDFGQKWPEIKQKWPKTGRFWAIFILKR
jgi:hypothetical protein